MARVNFEVIGVRPIEDKLTGLSRKETALENAALKAAAQPVLEAITEKAPERTGRGKSVVKIGKIRTLKGAKYISIGIHKEDHDKGLHMCYQEFGTRRHPAQPFIRPGYEEQKAAAFGIVKDALKAGLGL